MFRSSIQFILTLPLVIFFIGGGQVCGCEVLSWVGIEVHDHDDHHGHDCEEHHHNDCCEESLRHFDGTLPTPLSLSSPESEADPAPSYFELERSLSISDPFLRFVGWKHRPPPRKMAPPLTFLQRFQV